MSITSGVGLVSQMEKFGRVIAGSSYKNYLLLKKNDFAYNKSATKDYPEGFIALYTGAALAAVPNSIFTCFRIDGDSPVPRYLNYLFLGNLHGQWLRKFIEVGARAHGSLSIDDDDLLALPVPLPGGKTTRAEQQKIAECLNTLDELIGAESQKLDALKAHKQGLMQQLFPREGETLPRLRFSEFQSAPDWKSDSLGSIFETTSGGTPSRSEKGYWGGRIPWITTSLVSFQVITEAEEFITDDGLHNSSAKLFPTGTVLIAMYGQGKTRGQVALLGVEAATNQACAAILPRKGIDPYFVFLNLSGRYEELRKLSNSGGQENLSQGLIRDIQFSYPPDDGEQQKISDCLSSLNDLIGAQTDRIETLRVHKQGLMQQLFPSALNYEA
ncbi:MAG TPA: restriction endonuclease subunit S [Opitutaceae bacterium]|nr:restriction endonuclease subunit S [Opitutaceae bacterium]